MIKKVKILFRGYMLLVILTEKKLSQRFTNNNCKKQIKKFTVEKVIKRKCDKPYMLNGKATIVLSIVLFIKNT